MMLSVIDLAVVIQLPGPVWAFIFSTLLLLMGFFNQGLSQGQPPVFSPPSEYEEFPATYTDQKIQIDGLLDEKVWQSAEVITDFVQKEPDQKDPASLKTEVRVLYDNQNLYISAICFDDFRSRSNIRVQNMARDFDYFQNDLFGVAIDGFLDKRNAVSFQTTPYGAQRDLQVFDDHLFNREWDGLWYVRTSINDSSWVAEIAIPWKTLRYTEETDRMGVIFTRNIRRLNEYVVKPAVPRRFNVYRMAYQGQIVGIEPPPPSTNVQVNPYLLYQYDDRKQPGEEFTQSSPKLGGEVKWAVTPNTVLDLTLNTDFAQADADRQVVNLERYSVFFPERRQFFLESANIFNPAITTFVMPFFSRRIGLDDVGNPIPLDGGFRLTHQDTKQTLGVLAMRQRAMHETPQSNFAVMRYSRNLSSQNKLGGMITYRNDQLGHIDGRSGYQDNITATVDGFFRPHQSINIQGMLSASKDSELGDGLGGQGYISYRNNLLYIGLLEYLVLNYQPGMGLERFGRDYVLTSPALTFDLRPQWLPRQVRNLEPGFYAYLYNEPDFSRLIQGEVFISPFSFNLHSGAGFRAILIPTWQNLSNPFRPVGLEISPGNYQYLRTRLQAQSDLSSKVSGTLRYDRGGYFDGFLSTYFASTRIAPLPHLEFGMDYEFNQLQAVGTEQSDVNTHLIGFNTRLALNPRVQLIGFYQWNSSLNQSIWNVRFAWEYLPLSYLYLVYNQNNFQPLDSPLPFEQDQVIGKITLLRQF